MAMADLVLLISVFAIASLVYPAIRDRLVAAAIPAVARGTPITAVTALLLAIAVMGAVGGERGWKMFVALFAVTLLASRTESIVARARKKPAPSIEQIDRLLPQTQCGQCGYPGCKPYATAIARGEADINQCPPGGEAGIKALAELLGREVKPLNPEHGVEKPKVIALIREPECIGCTKCIQACPVDAIVGASKSMHVVLADLCTGCELCVPPCPVDCIDLLPTS